MRPAVAALLARVAIVLWVALSSFVIPSYDTSLETIAPNFISPFDKLVYRTLGRLGNWDGVYFSHIAVKGYTSEQFHAFFPLVPFFVRAVG
jgi:GPI mannosyltransferase 2